MRYFFVVLLAVSSAVAVSLNAEDETTREKRQVLVLVPQPPVQQQLVLVPAAAAPVETATCGVPAFVCEGPCISSSPGGIKAVKGEYPWLAQIYSGGRQICGASIIDNSYILTAATCVEPATPSSVAALRIRVGDFRLNTKDDGIFVERNVSVIYRHSEFAPPGKGPAVHDIALLKLTEPLQFNDYVRPICLENAQTRVANGFTEGITAGYGVLSYSGRPSTSDLYKVNLRIGSLQECSNAYAPSGVQLNDGQICAGTQAFPSIDPCVGDNGGPLFVKFGLNNYLQVGINSFGLKCNGPAPVYTRISKYRAWIDQVRLSKQN